MPAGRERTIGLAPVALPNVPLAACPDARHAPASYGSVLITGVLRFATALLARLPLGLAGLVGVALVSAGIALGVLGKAG